MAATRDVLVRFLGSATGLNNAANQGGAAVGKFSDKARKVAKMAAAGVAAAGVAAVAFIKAGVAGLVEGEEAESKFNQAMGKAPAYIRKASAAMKGHAEQVQKNTRFTYEDALAADTFIVSSDALQKSLKSGIVSAQDLTDTSLDLATVMKTDSTAAAKFLAKAMGSPEKAYTLLRKAGINLSAAEQEKVKAMVKSGRVANAQSLIYDVLREKTNGAAKAAGQTMTGQMERAKNAFGEVQESLASSLMPTITKLMGWLLKVSKWMEANPGKVKVIVAVLAGLAVVIGVVSAAVMVMNLALAVTAAPFLAVGLAVAAVVAGLVILYKKFDTARFIINAAIKALTLPFLTYVDATLWGFETILRGLGHLPKWLGGGKFDTAADAVSKLRGGIDRIRDGILALPTSAANDFTKALKKMTDQLNAIPNVTNVRIDVQTRNTVADVSSAGRPLAGGRTRAAGGPVSAGRSYLVGEKGPELFTPAGSGRITPNGQLPGARGADAGVPEIHVYLGDRELTDLVRVEVRESNRAMIRTARAGGVRTA